MAEAKLRGRAKGLCGEVSGDEFGPRRGGDHGGIVGREGKRREGDGQAAAIGFGLEPPAEFAVGGHPAGDDDAVGTEGFCSRKGLALEVADDGVLKGSNEVEGLLIAELYNRSGFGCEIWVSSKGRPAGCDARVKMVGLDVAQNRGFDTAEGEIEAGSFGYRGSFFVGGTGAWRP